MDAHNPNFPPFVGDSQFIRGLEAGIALTSAATHTTKGAGMTADVRTELIQGLGDDNADESGTQQVAKGIVNHFHDSCHVTIHQGFDAEAVERLITCPESSNRYR